MIGLWIILIGLIVLFNITRIEEEGMWNTKDRTCQGIDLKYSLIEERERYYIRDNFFGEYATFEVRREQYEGARRQCTFSTVIRRKNGIVNEKVMFVQVDCKREEEENYGSVHTMD